MVVGSQFTHATLLPAFTRTVGVAKAKSLMKTIVAPAALVGVLQVPVLTVVVEVARSEKHATTAREPSTTEMATKAGALRHESMRIVI